MIIARKLNVALLVTLSVVLLHYVQYVYRYAKNYTNNNKNKHSSFDILSVICHTHLKHYINKPGLYLHNILPHYFYICE